MTKLDTGTEDLLAEIEDGVALLTMHRPSLPFLAPPPAPALL